MRDEENEKRSQLVPASSAQVSLSKVAALARRGLQDLIQQDIHWTRKRVSPQDTGLLRLSSLGQFVTNWKSGSNHIHTIAVHDAENGQCFVIESPAFHPAKSFDVRLMQDIMESFVDCFSWSPCGRYLLTKSREYSGPLRLYDATAKEFLGVIGGEPECSAIGWSPKRRYVATAARAIDWSPLNIWRVEDLGSCSIEKESELNVEKWFGEATEFFRRYGGFVLNMFEGFSDIAFSPDEKTVALGATNRLEFAPDERPLSDDAHNTTEEEEEEEEEESPCLVIHSIVCFDVLTLRQTFRIETQHSVDSLTWLPSGKMVICGGGEASVLDPTTAQITPLPFQAEFRRSHPNSDVCAFASRQWPWGKLGSGERVFVVDLRDLRMITEEPEAGGICDMSWSVDGNTLYAVSAKGDFWVCNVSRAIT